MFLFHTFVICMYRFYRNHLLLMCTLVMVSNHGDTLACVISHNIGSINIPHRSHSNVFTGLLAGELMCVLCGYRV